MSDLSEKEERVSELFIKSKMLHDQVLKSRDLFKGNYDVIFQLDEIIHQLHKSNYMLMKLSNDLTNNEIRD